MNSKGITQFLLKHAGDSPVSFHMPGHKGSEFYRRTGYEDFLGKMMDCDITEIPGADNLFQMESIIRETADKYSRLYGVKASYPLINGTSGGLIAAVLASVRNGGKLIMARNCHKSVFNALTLCDAAPVYAYPSMIEEYGISGEITAEEIETCLKENPDADAVLLPSPNYYGICSDIKRIAEIVHAYGRILIVDQAHGAHLKFMKKQPQAAEDCGADIVVNSIHKTLGSFTQSAVLNLNSERVSQHVLEDKLQAIQSTSPSYLLMASLDINADILDRQGDELLGQWQQNIEEFYSRASEIPGIRLMTIPGHMDSTKINIDMSAYGIDGGRLEEMLMEQGIYAELTTGNILMCMTGIGNRKEDFDKLLNALKMIADENALVENMQNKDVPDGAALWSNKRPLHRISKRRELKGLEECEGRICASSVIPYPPGIPFLCPGEQIGAQEIAYIRQLRENGEKVIGVNEKMQILVGMD
ncbi:MAG: aminotransferase class V-fold PLP-dependent enzyme [Bacillota bacterium]|nr:aminotransferase class V-fold PLP-dependent enzyme [Bacillota bacterium]